MRRLLHLSLQLFMLVVQVQASRRERARARARQQQQRHEQQRHEQQRQQQQQQRASPSLAPLIAVSPTTSRQDAVLTPSPDFGKHVARASQFTDQNSRRKVRTYQLYSRTSGKHVQVLGRRVVAQGEDGDPYAQLVAETDTFGGNIRLRGAQTGYYICMNKRGKLVGKKNGRGRYCVFKEVYLENNYTALVNSRHPNWYMAFNRQGRAKNGARTRPRQRDVHLIKRPIQGRDADYNFPPFCIVRSRRRTRRMRMLKRCTNRRSA